MTKSLDNYHEYLKRRLRFHESMLAIVEHSTNHAEIERHQLLYDQLEDIIQHFEEFVKDDLDSS